MFKWLTTNKEWFFAGTGGVIITLIATFTFNYYTNYTQKNDSKEYKKIESVQKNQNIEEIKRLCKKIGNYLSHFKYLANILIFITFIIILIAISIIIYGISVISGTEISLSIIIVFFIIVYYFLQTFVILNDIKRIPQKNLVLRNTPTFISTNKVIKLSYYNNIIESFPNGWNSFQDMCFRYQMTYNDGSHHHILNIPAWIEKNRIKQNEEEAESIINTLKKISGCSKNIIDNKNGTVTDNTTKLMWLKGGSKNSMIFDDAKSYTSNMNSKKFAGFNNWRFPTLEELLSLLNMHDTGKKKLQIATFDEVYQILQDKNSNFNCKVSFFESVLPIFFKKKYIFFTHPLFNLSVQNYWSSDFLDFENVWCMNFYYGKIFFDKMNNSNYVLVVRSL